MTAKITTLIVKVQDEAVGPVMRALNGWPGVTNIAMDQGPTKQKREAADKPPRDKSVGPPRGNLTGLVLTALGEGKKSRTELRELIGKAGMRPNSVSSLIDRLGKQGHIKGDSSGYTLTPEGKRRLT